MSREGAAGVGGDGQDPLQARGVIARGLLCRTGQEKGGLLADRGKLRTDSRSLTGWWWQAPEEQVARQEDSVRALLLGFVLSAQADKGV